MNNQSLDDLPALVPMDAFAFEIPLLEKERKLPDFSDLLAEEPFAKISAKKSAKGLHFSVAFQIPFEQSLWPEFRKGESVELFLDTRNNKSAGYPTRFCHHFVFLPKEFEGEEKGEITRLRHEEARPLAKSELLQLETTFKRNSLSMQIFLPSETLYGYDPSSFNQLGFAYRLNRSGGLPMHFPLHSDHYDIAMHPSLWSTLNL